MKRIIIKAVAFVLTFFISVFIFGRIMSYEQVNMTFDMDPASQPVIYMSIGDLKYNMLRGYSGERDISYLRDTLTFLDSDRSVGITVDTFGQKIAGLSYALRNIEDDRLIEEGTVELELNRIGNQVGKVSLKDLMISGAQYCLLLDLSLEDGRDIYYYTRVISGDYDLAKNQIEYAKYFHDSLLDKTKALNVKKHLETNSALNDNSTFAYVDIHSSFSQATYGELGVEGYGEPLVYLMEQSGNDAMVGIDYMLRSGFGSELKAYSAHESITVRYTDKNVYIMNYVRTMEEIPSPLEMCVNDKIALGIADENPEMMESENGNCVGFVSGGRLFSYNEESGRFACVYSFYDFGNFDIRNICDKHGIRILQLDDNGNMIFAVYGYMNRGTHEGDVGIAVFSYDDEINSIKEILYIPYEKSEEILMEEMGRLLYMNNDNHLYFTLENSVYRVDTEEKTIRTTGMYWSGDTLQTSRDQRLIVTMGADVNIPNASLTVTDLETESSVTISGGQGEYVRFLGFIGEDMVYGIARQSDVVYETSGNLLFPMYRVCICDGTGMLLKYYEKEGYYVSGVDINDSRIVLYRVSGAEGIYRAASDDSIMSSSEDEFVRNRISVAVIDKFERYVQIQTGSEIKPSRLRVTTPGEVLTDEVVQLSPEHNAEGDRFYAYDMRGGCRIFITQAAAINYAYETGGVAVEENGNVIWKYAAKKSVNQIMEIGAREIGEGESALSVCMDEMMKYEGVIRNSEVLLSGGDSIEYILSENMEGVSVLDLSGCSIDKLYFYMDSDIPVLALLQTGSAVLIIGHNDRELVLMDPSYGELKKEDISVMSDVFERGGNQFITYAYSTSENWAKKTGG